MKVGDLVRIKNYTDNKREHPVARIIEVSEKRVKVRLDGIGGIFVFLSDDVEVIG